jgi:uncharacterized repeat protein (TIGR03803 family)
MRFHAATGVVLSTLALFMLGVVATQAQTFTVLHTFTGEADGYQSYAGLTLDGSGNLYGTTTEYQGPGTVFQLKRSNGTWNLNTLFVFNGSDGSTPQGRVVFGPNGTLYGTTTYGGSGGAGTVFNLRPAPNARGGDWTETLLYSFTGGADGSSPWFVDPVFDQEGNLYGTTIEGGSGEGGAGGVVFKLAPYNGGWTQSVIHSFTGTDHPYSGVIFDATGNLYGTTSEGGGSAYGDVFQLAPSGSGWTANNLYDFQGGSDGAVPVGSLTFDRSGNLYGTTSTNRFSNGGGTVFELSPSRGNWMFALVYGLSGSGDGGPEGNLVIDAAGNLYGTTYSDGAFGAGSVFKLKPTTGDGPTPAFTILPTVVTGDIRLAAQP